LIEKGYLPDLTAEEKEKNKWMMETLMGG